MKFWIDFKTSLQIVAATSLTVIALFTKLDFLQFKEGSIALHVGFIILMILNFIGWLSFDLKDDTARSLFSMFSIFFAIVSVFYILSCI